MQPRVLLVLPQLPHDPASGAARTVSTIAEFLVEEGFAVRGLGTTMSDAETAPDFAQVPGSAEAVRRTNDATAGAPNLSLLRRGVEYVLQDVGACRPFAWEERHGRDFDRIFDHLLNEFRPDVLFGFGADAAAVERRRRAQAAGACVVFGLFTSGHLNRGIGPHVDSVLTPSRFITDRYRERWGIESTPLPTPIQLDDVLSPARVPTRVTVVNPSVGKGVMLLARLADVLASDHPEIPIEFIASRASGRLLVQAGFAGGFDLRGRPNVIFRPVVLTPRDVYGHTRLLLVPSVAEEASARVVAEAMLNGIPVIASDRGGLPENCAGGGFVLPLPATLTVNTRRPVSSDDVASWLGVIEALFSNEAAYELASCRARAAGQHFLPRHVTALYGDFFRAALRPARPARPWCSAISEPDAPSPLRSPPSSG